MAARKAMVLGLGASGEAAARLLRREGYAVTVADSAPAERVAARAAELAAEGIAVAAGAEALPAMAAGCELTVVSPGIPASNPWIAAQRAACSEIVSELELGWRHCRSRMLAVTGSNGKSSVVKLSAEVLQQAGLSAVPGGNYGIPVSALALREPAPDWIVAEVSSFQLEHVDRFRPGIGILLNLQPNHLDRHGDFDTYARTKHRLFARMQPGDTGIVPDALADAVRAGSGGRCDWRTFGASPACDTRYEPGRLVWREGGREAALDIVGSPFDNEVLGPNAAAVLAAVLAAGVPPAAAAAAMRAYVPLLHRMSPVGERDGVLFVDDSKATTLAAMCAALRMCSRPVRLVAGGMLKEKQLETVKEILAKKVRRIYLIGRDSSLMEAAWRDAVSCVECGTLDRAVQMAWRDAVRGDVILLSPACASFDQFSGFEERGRRFASVLESAGKGEVS